jgi:two-component system, LytTR family, sensor kinase
MKLKMLLTIYGVALIQISNAQIKWSVDSLNFTDIGWNNFSTTYIQENNSTTPFLVAAIPYNGIYERYDSNERSALDLSFTKSDYRFRSNLSDTDKPLYTYDSSSVYFLAPGIHENNLNYYDFRILLNGRQEIKPWSDILQLTDSSFQLNTFKKQFAFLGGYQTTWGNFIVAELRDRRSGKIISKSTVYWKESQPVILSVFTSKDLIRFLQTISKSFDSNIDKGEIKILQGTKLSVNAEKTLSPEDDNIIFAIDANIYSKKAIEYQLIKNGEIVIPWKSNDFANNFIWLKDLNHGKYEIQIRYSTIRQNITKYEFLKEPFWFQTLMFKVISFVLLAVFLGFFVLLLVLKNQKKKLYIIGQKKNKIEYEIRSIRSQLNPHFIFNALSSIQALINKNDTPKANYYLNEFSSLLRETLVTNDKIFAPLKIELGILENYIRLEKLRFNFQYFINIDASLNINEIEVPTLFLQPLVENGIKHGINSYDEKGIIRVDFKRSNSDLLIEIHDNGKGFATGTTNEGFGLKLTKERIKLINKSLVDQSIDLNIKSGHLKGTNILIKFKNWL